MAKDKKVLLLYITEVSGHHSAALSVQKALEANSGVSVCCVNAFKYAFPLAERIIHHAYLAVIKKVPKLWEKIYDNPVLIGRSQGLKNGIHFLGIRKIQRLISDFQPDVVACTQAFPCGIVADYKKASQASLPLIAILTDLAPHSFWVYETVDYYIASCPEAELSLIKKGVAREKIKTFGIPIDPKFSQYLDRGELAGAFGLDPALPVLMLMGGGHGLGPIKDAIRALDRSEKPLQLMVVCGINQRIYRWIRKQRFKNKVLSFGFTEKIDRLMSLADVIITKPGGITTAEALAKGLPMIILNPIPGQEARNTDILMRHGAALKIDSPEELLPAAARILENSTRNQDAGRVVNELARPRSAVDIADFILGKMARNSVTLR